MSKLQGEEAFQQYFTSLYGDRWEQIYNSLLEDDCKIARKNLFNDVENSDLKALAVGEPIAEWPHCFQLLDNFDPTLWNQEIKPFYRMDPASIAPAKALEVEVGESVLDMCAAPGGKTLILLEDLFIKENALDLNGKLIANELSAKRRHRMMSVFKSHLPKEVRKKVEITGFDGSKIGLFKKSEFDRILLDAPCSGERGLVHKKSELALWKEKRSKNFGIRQYSLLASAFSALKAGGRIVYSTCSISPYENDEVVAKLLKRKKDQVQVEKIEVPPMSEATEWGYQFLPDKNGWGPIYFAVISKLES